MELVCDAHADGEDGDGSDGDLEDDDFEPELRRLVIYRKNFCQPSEEPNYWMDIRMGLRQLTIAQYTPGESDQYNLYNFINSLGFLEQLKFEGLHFSIYPNRDFESFLHLSILKM